MKHQATSLLLSASVLILCCTTTRAGVFDRLNTIVATNSSATNAASGAGTSSVKSGGLNGLVPGLAGGSVASLAPDQMVNGLKEALSKGIRNAVSSLGKNDGFLTNVNVKISMPDKLKKVESGLRLAGQGQIVDDFITSMNRAAEQAVPVAANVFADAMKQMSITDAQNILQGAPDAATQFFRRTTQTNLQAKFYPLVQKATDSVGVTAKYKQMMTKFNSVNTMSSLFGSKPIVNLDVADIDTYVTGKAMDGLFSMVAEEEKNIRANPVARTTDLLKTVFGAVSK